MIRGFFKILFIALISMLFTLISFVILDVPNIQNIIEESKISENISFTILSGKKISNIIQETIKNVIIDEGLDENSVEDFVNEDIFQDTGLFNFLSENSNFINSIENIDLKIYKEKLDHKALDKFTNLEVNAENISIIIKKGDEYSYTIYGTKKNDDPYKNLEIEKSNQKDKYEIIEKSNSKKLKYKIEITTPNPDELIIDFLSENGALELKDSIKSLKGNIENGLFIIKGKNSYPMDISGIHMVVHIKLSDFDANIEIKTENSILNILDKGYLRADNLETFNKIVGSGKDKINIVAENAIIDISQ